ncbi:MAG TPA: dihydrolipoyllysine-residue succinyltransferase, partial [Bacillales bacterium]|nr:dihydrolipoyllysine-residue succinyltransferase [Bacillales bacterium]
MIEVKVPELAESISEGTISEWLKNVGEQVNKGEDIVELETDKVNLQVSAEDSGVLKELKKEPGDTVQVGEVIAVLDENAEASAGGDEAPAADEEKEPSDPKEQPQDKQASAPQSGKPAADAQPSPQAAETSGNRPVASPAARKLARERGIDLSKVPTQDPLGRVRPEDVKNYTEQPQQPRQPQSQPVQPQQPEKPVERIKMSRRRQTIANRLLEVKNTTAMLTTFNEVDMSAILDLRSRRKESFQKQHDVRLGFMSFFTKAVVGALRQFPLLNAEIQGNEIVMKKFYDIGIAVAAKEGLVVPVVRNADQLTFAEIEAEIGRLAEKARSNKLALDDLQGGSFSITNGGVFGSLLSTPI